METNETIHHTNENKAGFWHTGWAWIVFFLIITMVMVALYYILQYFGWT